MVQQQSPTTASPDLDTPQRPALNLFLVAGWWQAACPSCGYVLVEARSQAKVERKAARTSCPVCNEFA